MSWRPTLIAIAALTATSGFASEHTAIEEARRVWAAYAVGEYATVASSLEVSDSRRSRMMRDWEMRCPLVLESAMQVTEETVDAATVWIDSVEAQRFSRTEGSARVDDEHLEVQLRRAHGRWRVVQWSRREELLAAEVARTSPVRRRSAIAQNPRLRTPALAIALGHLAFKRVNQQLIEDAAQILSLAAEIAHEAGDHRALATILGTESVLLRRKMPPSRAESIRVGEEAEALAVRSGDLDAIALTRVHLGRALELDDPARSEALLLTVLDDADNTPDPTPIAFAASQLARMSDDRVEHARARRFALIASRHAELSGDSSARLNAALNLAGSYHYAGVADLAAKYFEQALEIARASGSTTAAAFAATRLVTLYTADPGTRGQADTTAQEALALASCAASQNERNVHLLWVRADNLSRASNRVEALRTVAEAYAMALATGTDKRLIANILELEARLLIEEGDPLRAAERLTEASALLEGGDQQYLALSYIRALTLLGRPREALSVAHEAIDAAEKERDSFALDALTRQAYLQERAALYHELINLHIDQGQVEQALAVADRLSARTLRDFQRTGSRDGVADSPEIIRAERTVVELNRTVLASRLDDAREVATDRLRAARAHLDDLRSLRSSETESLAPPEEKPFDPPAAAAGSVVIKYVVTDRRTIVFTVLPSAAISVKMIDVSRGHLEAEVETLLAQLESRDSRYPATAELFHRRFIAPILPGIGSSRRLVLIPDGALWLIPFQALRDGDGRYMVDRFDIAYAPSLSWIGNAQQLVSATSILAIGDPEIGAVTRATVRSLLPGRELGTLPDAAREARRVAVLYPRRRVLTGNAAEEGVVKRELGEYDVVHLATHAFLEERQPMYSSIVLAASPDGLEDGLLEVREIALLPLRARMVVLSACSTARGRFYTGEGVVGLTWAFLSRGVSRVVASQWRADSQATAALMIAFHREYRRGASPARALRTAARELRGNPRYADPLYWAPFIVIGEN